MILPLINGIHYVVLNILDYLKYDTTTSINKINEHESQFPTVSFCMKNETNFKIKFVDI